MGRWLETYQTPEEILMGKIKATSLSIIAKYKAENPDFDIDFESFVKELTTDETQLTRLFEILIKDSYKRTKRSTRTSPQVAPTAPPPPSEARFARLIQQHQQQRLLAARSAVENEQSRDVLIQHQQQRLLAARSAIESEQSRDVMIEGQRYRILRPRSPMDVDSPIVAVGPPRTPTRDDVPPQPAAAREEDKEEDGTMDGRETGLGTVVVA